MTAVAMATAEPFPGRSEVEELAREVGDAYYLLDLDRVRESHDRILEAFRRAYPDTILAYSVKTCYVPRVLRLIRELGSEAEIVSEMEYDIAVRSGFSPREILVNGALHRPDFLERVLLSGMRVNLDGWYMLEILERLGRSHPDRTFRVGVRLSYPLPETATSRFGFETTEANMSRLAEWFWSHDNCELVGLHSHFPLAPARLDVYRARVERMAAAARTWFPWARLSYLDVGSIFRALPEGPTLEEVVDAVAEALVRAYPEEERPTLVIEPGTAIVSRAMWFVCRVYDVKRAGGRTLALVDGSTTSFNTMGWHGRIPVTHLHNGSAGDAAGGAEAVDVVGNTAMERKDYLCTDLPGPVAPGDFLVFAGVGAYSCALNPPFIHPCPAMVGRQGGRLEVVKRRETADDVLGTYEV